MAKHQRRTEADLADELAQQFGKPDPAPEEWYRHYTPEQIEQYAGELADLEAQLDEHWPGWRKREPFATQPLDKIAWIKVRLKRRDLIIHGQGAWGVRVVYKGDFPYAIPVRPARVEVTDRSAYDPHVSVPQLARRFRRRPAEIHAALAKRPPEVRDVPSWLESHFGSGGAAGAVVPPPAPAPAVPAGSQGAPAVPAKEAP